MWKQLLALALFSTAVMTADECPVERETHCVDQFQVALPYCKKAAESQGKDFDADINCLKYSIQTEQDCWPCICYIANKENLKVRGCTHLIHQ